MRHLILAATVALAALAGGCGSSDQPEPVVTPTSAPTVPASPATTTEVEYASCAEAEAAGVTPIHAGDPGYSASLDRDGDGTACDG